MTDGTGTTSYGYDGDGQLTSTANGAGATVGYTYDPAGDLTAISYPNGQIVTRHFDGADRLVSVTDWAGHKTSFGYDADGNLVSTAYPNHDTVSTSVDRTGAITDTALSSTSAGSLADISYSRDEDDNIVQEKDSGALTGTTSYTFDDHSRLTAAGTSNYSYDPDGNLVGNDTAAQTYTAGGELRTATAGTRITAYRYDPDGDLTTATPSSGVETDYNYDQAGRQTAVARLTYPRPMVSAVSPASGLVSGGTTVTVTGTGFTGATQVCSAAWQPPVSPWCPTRRSPPCRPRSPPRPDTSMWSAQAGRASGPRRPVSPTRSLPRWPRVCRRLPGPHRVERR